MSLETSQSKAPERKGCIEQILAVFPGFIAGRIRKKMKTIFSSPLSQENSSDIPNNEPPQISPRFNPEKLREYWTDAFQRAQQEICPMLKVDSNTVIREFQKTISQDTESEMYRTMNLMLEGGLLSEQGKNAIPVETVLRLMSRAYRYAMLAFSQDNQDDASSENLLPFSSISECIERIEKSNKDYVFLAEALCLLGIKVPQLAELLRGKTLFNEQVTEEMLTRKKDFIYTHLHLKITDVEKEILPKK